MEPSASAKTESEAGLILRRGSEGDLHAFLKKLAVVFLYNQGCFFITTEADLGRLGQLRLDGLDSGMVIDVVGVGLEPRTFDASEVDRSDGLLVIRGVEVKVSRSDFKNGFVCSGCSYNYLLTPMRMVAPSELPRGVGLIEYNKHKYEFRTQEQGFDIKGLTVVKKPTHRRLSPIQLDISVASLFRRTQQELLGRILKEMEPPRTEEWEQTN